MRRSLMLLGIGLAALALLNGCDESGSDEDPAGTPASTATDASPPSTSPSAPTATATAVAATASAAATPADTISAGGDPYAYDYPDSGTATPAAGTAAPTSPGGKQTAAEIVNSTLPDLVVSVGETVSWANRDAIPHTVTASDGSFDSGTIGATPFTHTFTIAGTFEYACAIHSGMRATVTVR